MHTFLVYSDDTRDLQRLLGRFQGLSRGRLYARIVLTIQQATEAANKGFWITKQTALPVEHPPLKALKFPGGFY